MIMNESQKIALQEKLLGELERITVDIKSLEEITKPVGAEDMDDITRMDSIVNKSVNSAALSASRSRQAGLEYALKRIGDAEFGYCSICGEEIPFARLLAMPEATLCVDCAH